MLIGFVQFPFPSVDFFCGPSQGDVQCLIMPPINAPCLQARTSLSYIIIFLGPYLIPLWGFFGYRWLELNESILPPSHILGWGRNGATAANIFFFFNTFIGV